MKKKEQSLKEKVEKLIKKDKDKTKTTENNRPVWLKLVLFGVLFIIQIAVFFFITTYVRDSLGFLLVLIPLIEFLVFIYIFNNMSNPMYKMAWLLLIIALPVFGILIYLYANFDYRQRKTRRRFASLFNRYYPLYENLVDEEIQKELAHEVAQVGLTSEYLLRSRNFPAYAAQGVQYQPEGMIHFEDMLVELEKAKKFIFLEYFILVDGYMWQAILQILKEKVKEGVEVRLMVDGAMAFANLPDDFERQMEGYGINTRIFMPLKPIFSPYQNHRDHRKILIIDGEIAYTGGLNIADEYINRKVRFGYWKDSAVKIQGDAVDSFTLMFLEVWNILEDGYLEEKYLREEKSDLPRDGYVIPYDDSPYDYEDTGKEVYLDIIHQARKYIHVTTPYLIIDYEMQSALSYAAKSGIDVKIVLPHIPDKPWVFYTSRTFYKELIEAGVKIYEFVPGFLHAKTFVSDDIKAVVGTINMDYRSLYLHLECGAYFYQTDVSRQVEEDFQNILEDSKEITKEIYQDFPFHQRVIGRVMRLIAPLL